MIRKHIGVGFRVILDGNEAEGIAEERGIVISKPSLRGYCIVRVDVALNAEDDCIREEHIDNMRVDVL